MLEVGGRGKTQLCTYVTHEPLNSVLGTELCKFKLKGSKGKTNKNSINISSRFESSFRLIFLILENMPYDLRYLDHDMLDKIIYF